jgi:hypothetical protein
MPTARCAGKAFFPLDEQLNLRDTHWSEQVAKQAVWLAGFVPFAQAAAILHTVGGIEMSASSVWRCVERWGTHMQAVETRQQVKAYELVEPRPHDPNRSLGKMGVALDGTMIYIRQEGWKELKVGCVFEVAARTVRDPETQEAVTLGRAVKNTYVAHLGSPEAFGRHLWAEARPRGWMDAVDTVALGDGAAWIWNLVSEHFYASHQVVDWYHAAQHLTAAARTLHGEGTPAQRRWVRRWETKLYQGHVRALVKTLRQHARQKPGKAEELLQQATYFQNNLKRMNYLEMRMEGYPIGSGMIESGAKQYKGRFCGAGMRWSRTGAERMTPLRSAILSKRFDKLWQLAYNSPPN